MYHIRVSRDEAVKKTKNISETVYREIKFTNWNVNRWAEVFQASLFEQMFRYFDSRVNCRVETIITVSFYIRVGEKM